MPTNKTQAFEAYGAKLRNVRWSYAALTPDGELVVQLWSDKLKGDRGHWRYNDWGNEKLAPGNPGTRRRGNLERTAFFTQIGIGGLFRVVIGFPTKSPSDGKTRGTKAAEAANDVVMRLVDLDEATGRFIAEQVATS
jgi:hypothetical protein